MSKDDSSSKGCVVLINDNSDLLKLFKEALEIEKIQTYVFTDSDHALEKIKSHPDLCSVVITDYASQLKRSHRRFAKDVKALKRTYQGDINVRL